MRGTIETAFTRVELLAGCIELNDLACDSVRA
jgi:hypothetical protein